VLFDGVDLGVELVGAFLSDVLLVVEDDPELVVVVPVPLLVVLVDVGPAIKPLDELELDAFLSEVDLTLLLVLAELLVLLLRLLSDVGLAELSIEVLLDTLLPSDALLINPVVF